MIDKDNEFLSIIHLVKYKGKLGLIFKNLGSDFEIWELKDYGNHVWKMIKKISVKGAKKKEPYCVPHAIGLYSSNISF